ncbi:hypothetical protein [Streptomyces sp. ISL-94]|uniref:hypothetical protein n=1 Tax=Streptomyces sp. ISL-94 TaxID=2819190 RepID=UPI001BE7C222|nr:hypothetical protein [Streptomyces sp. ISL-94]MBT2482669.1 hypothetical protein [Streptomyces sp. ISL-94]
MAQHWTHRGVGRLPPQPPRPGVIPLRPLWPRDILGGALTILGRYGGRLLGALLLGQLAGLLVLAAVAGAATLASLTRTAGSRVFVYTLLPATALFLLFGWALATALAAALLRPAVLGRPVTALGLLRAAGPRVPAVCGARLLALLAAAGPGAVALAAGLPPLAVLPLAPVAIWLGVLFALAPTAAGYEELGPVAALRRSARLVRGAWWRTLGITVPAGVLALSAAYAVQSRFGVLGSLLAPALLLTLPQPASGLLYMDRLLRREPALTPG